MKTIRISDEVWDAIAARGKFGETEDHVLRRAFNISAENSNPELSSHGNRQRGWKERRAKDEMTQRVEANKLILQFESGPRFERTLPTKSDRISIRKVRDEAIEFVRSNAGTKGQEHAAIRALTSRGYHVSKVDLAEYV